MPLLQMEHKHLVHFNFAHIDVVTLVCARMRELSAAAHACVYVQRCTAVFCNTLPWRPHSPHGELREGGLCFCEWIQVSKLLLIKYAE